MHITLLKSFSQLTLPFCKDVQEHQYDSTNSFILRMKILINLYKSKKKNYKDFAAG